MHFIYLIISVFFISCIANNSTGKQNIEEINPKGNMSVEKNRISVKATINDTDTVTFMFDTGASVGALLPDSLAKRYKDMRQLKIALANGEKHNNIDLVVVR